LGVLAGGEKLGINASDDALALMAAADGVIDFTTPAASVELAGLAAQARSVHIIGTTGFDAAQEEAIAAAARHARIVKSGNMSLGVNVLAGLVKQAAAQLGDDWDIEILDMHHRHKVDAPSGTALLLGAAAADGRGVDLDDRRESGRDGIGEPRATGAIGFAALRGGSVVGDHEVILAGENEQIRLVHRAEDRDIFARGALKAAQWAHDKSEGLYTMQNVLGL
jgi:4-hydroxy-tetrahydrodipicolinate reductase